MANMRMLTLLATTAALAIAVGGSASAQSVVDESVESAPGADPVDGGVTVDEGVVDESVVDEGVVDGEVVDGGVVIDDGGIIPVEVVADDKVDGEIVLADVDLGVPVEPSPDQLENPDVIFYTMAGGGAENFDSGAAAAELAVEQAADQALEKIGAPAPAPTSLAPSKD